MTGFRPPIVAGVSGGVGATTLALALHGRDAGTATADADVLVCRSAAESLDRAARITDLAEHGRYPVLVVTLDGSERRPPARVDRLDDDRWAAVVVVPHVGRWREMVDPYREAAGLLGVARDGLPRGLRAYLEAVTRAAQVVADSGRLSVPTRVAFPAPPAAGHHAAMPRTTASATSNLDRAYEMPVTAEPGGHYGTTMAAHTVPETYGTHGPPIEAHGVPSQVYGVPVEAHGEPRQAYGVPIEAHTVRRANDLLGEPIAAHDVSEPSQAYDARAAAHTVPEPGAAYGATVASQAGPGLSLAYPEPVASDGAPGAGPARSAPVAGLPRPEPGHPYGTLVADCPEPVPGGFADAPVAPRSAPVVPLLRPVPEIRHATASLSTMDSTGCGEPLSLPELRPVRGIRVLAVGIPG